MRLNKLALIGALAGALVLPGATALGGELDTREFKVVGTWEIGRGSCRERV